MRLSALFPAAFALILSGSAALAQTRIIPLSRLVEDHGTEPTIIAWDRAAESYGVLKYDPAELASEMELKDPAKLENPVFKVVLADGNTPLGVEDFDGRNVLFHLEWARKYFETLDPANPALSRPIVVRVRVGVDYNYVTHFAEIPHSNSSRYIPANYRGKWGREIWFHTERTDVHWKRMAFGVGTAVIWRSWYSLASIPFTIRRAIEYGLDTAKCPSVIYHEAFHWASDRPGFFPVNPYGEALSEDFANYFAASIEGRPVVGEPGDFSDGRFVVHLDKVRDISAQARKRYYNHTEFVPALLWKIRETIGDAFVADHVIWSAIPLIGKPHKYAALPDALRAALKAEPAVTAAQYAEIDSLLVRHASSFAALDKIFEDYQNPVKGSK